MSEFIDLSSYNPDDIPEGKTHPDGTEVNARITNMTKGTDKNNTPFLSPWFEDADDANVEDWSDYIPLPEAEASEKDNGKRLRKLKAFDESFQLGIFNAAFDISDAKGATGYQILGIGKDQDGNPNNKVKKYLVQQ
jgi:hypothetical protein